MKIYNKILVIAAILFVGFAGCKKSETGFLSENVFYRSNPMVAEQGAVTYSTPLEVDGSTAPISVKLLDVRDKATGKSVIDSFLKEREITTFLGEITSADTSLEMINKKLTKKMVKPFNVGEIGGRLEFSAATKHLAAGTYEIDIEIKNVKGTRVLKNVCDIVIKAPVTAYNYSYKAWTVSTIGTEIFGPAPGDPDFSISYDPTGENQIILKFTDKFGTPYNPKANEVVGRPGRPNLKYWDPYYPEIRTDSTIIYRYPETGLAFPLLQTVLADNGSSWSDAICYYRVLGTANDLGVNVNPVFTCKFLRSGTYKMTFRLYNTVHK